MVDLAGWIGAAVLLCGYALVSGRRLRPDGLLYQGLNLVGSVLLLVNTYFHAAYPSAFVNLVWLGIAALALAAAWRARRARDESASRQG